MIFSSIVMSMLTTLMGSVIELWQYTAPWCGSCQDMKPVVRQLQQAGVPMRIINVDDQRDEAQQAGITKLPTILVVDDGRVLQAIEGAAGYAELLDLYQQTAAVGRSADTTIPHPIERALAATVRLRVEDASGISLGTGTIVDVHENEALVLTCGHIFRDSQGKGTIHCDLFAPGGASGIEGKLISFDARRDVGLVSLRPNVPVEAVKIRGSGYRPQEQDAVFSLGCNRGEAPTVIRNRIISINRYHGPANFVVGGRPVDGRSGGGLFDDEGQLIGVCNAADPERDEGLYAALGPVHAELDGAGLGFVYRPLPNRIAQANHGAPNSRAVERNERSNSHSNRFPQLVGAPEATGISQANQTIMISEPVGAVGASPPMSTLPHAGHADTEVICIVRSKSNAGSSTAYVLDQPSPELLSRLSSEMSRRGPLVATSHLQAQPQVVDVEPVNSGAWQSGGR